MEALLYNACALGDVEQVIKLLGSARKSDKKGASGDKHKLLDSSLGIGLGHERRGRKCELDLSKGQGPNETTLIHLACATGNVRTLVVLLDELCVRVPNANARLALLEQRECARIGGYTALHHACSAGNVDVVRLLLEQGVDPDVKDFNCGFTALHIAVRRSHLDVARELVCRGGASTNARDDFGNNPAYWLKELCIDDEQIAQLLGPPRCASIEERFHAINNHRVKHNFPIATLRAAPTSDIASYKSKLKGGKAIGGKKKKGGAKTKKK